MHPDPDPDPPESPRFPPSIPIKHSRLVVAPSRLVVTPSRTRAKTLWPGVRKGRNSCVQGKKSVREIYFCEGPVYNVFAQ